MNAIRTALENNLKQEVEGARELVSVLQEEQNQLLDSSIDELEPLVSRKAQLVAKISEHTRHRHENLTKAGFEPNSAGMGEWLKSNRNNINSIKIRDEWTELISLTQSAKELNRLNGMLISTHMVRNQQALNILRNERDSATTGMYGPDGQQSRPPATPMRSVVTG